jgi:hypothetical protein
MLQSRQRVTHALPLYCTANSVDAACAEHLQQYHAQPVSDMWQRSRPVSAADPEGVYRSKITP